ncbi:hypothetical protein K9N68_07870 [Kovacikia minuta CCNUW1]|uniref:hypothetical protein n=1 Tax=Kovacikia minuta TaxID=2931930 RepID=UPI001CCE50FD|nr:hypothetical protein [Kovacikia minuta]UBF27817.1 hypothetical protein K9N68_07870 [Kovacikia minuta CCNUW1]
MTTPSASSNPDSTTKERLEVIDTRMEHLNAITQRIAEAVEINTYQLGVLTEMVTSGFSEVKAIAQQQNERLDQMIELQERMLEVQDQNISRLVATVERKAQTVERQAQMVERMFQNQKG